MNLLTQEEYIYKLLNICNSVISMFHLKQYYKVKVLLFSYKFLFFVLALRRRMSITCTMTKCEGSSVGFWHTTSQFNHELLYKCEV